MSLNFTKLLKELIIESSRYQVLYDKYVKPKNKGQKGIMPFQTLFTIIAADPTSSIPEGVDSENVTESDMDKIKIGKYVQWMLKNFSTPKLNSEYGTNEYKNELKSFQELFLEDLYKITGDLMKYERFKNRLPQELRDINKLTPETLYDNVKDFSLEKTKASKEEKREASKTYEHPGGKVVYRGKEWTVVEISDTGQLGKDAACFYGGYYLEPSKGETRWCTSSPGLNWFDRYIKDGPLYVVIPNTPKKFNDNTELGEKSGLPSLRYQFHFPSNQFMDPSDRQIDLISFLNTNEEGLKEFFKPEFMKSISGPKGNKVEITYPTDSASKFIALYGFDELFQSLPESLERFVFVNQKTNEPLYLNLPNDIGRFKNLIGLVFQNCLSSLPESICNLEKLSFLSLIDNPKLQPIPECMTYMKSLRVLNIPGTPESSIPKSLIERSNSDDNFHIF
jgi:hypothetical protein